MNTVKEEGKSTLVDTIKPEQCLMVGNSVVEDMCVAELECDTYLITDNLLETDMDISMYRSGCFQSLLNYVQQLPEISKHHVNTTTGQRQN